MTSAEHAAVGASAAGSDGRCHDHGDRGNRGSPHASGALSEEYALARVSTRRGDKLVVTANCSHSLSQFCSSGVLVTRARRGHHGLSCSQHAIHGVAGVRQTVAVSASVHARCRSHVEHCTAREMVGMTSPFGRHFRCRKNTTSGLHNHVPSVVSFVDQSQHFPWFVSFHSLC